MGLKSSALVLAAGAAIATYSIPESREFVIKRANSTIERISSLLASISPSLPQDKSVLRPLQQPYSHPSQTQTLQTEDGRVIQSWNYRGNEWPKGWRVINEDGSYNRDYIRWYEGKHR